MALPFEFPCLQAIRKRNEATVSERNYKVFKETCEICPSAKNAKEKTTPLRKTQEHAKHAKHAKKKIGTIDVHTNMYVSGRTKKSALQKSLLTANCGAFSLRQNSKYPYVSPEPIRFYLLKRRQPETVQNSKPPLVRHVTVTSVGIKLKTQGGYRHRTSDTWGGEK